MGSRDDHDLDGQELLSESLEIIANEMVSRSRIPKDVLEGIALELVKTAREALRDRRLDGATVVGPSIEQLSRDAVHLERMAAEAEGNPPPPPRSAGTRRFTVPAAPSPVGDPDRGGTMPAR